MCITPRPAIATFGALNAVMLTLYSMQSSGNSYKVRVLLARTL